MLDNPNIIKIKGKIGQLLCRHKNTQWFVKESRDFQPISGEIRVHVCKDCGKEVSRYFAQYEGMGFK